MLWPATWTLLAARVFATALAASAVAAAPVSFPVAATLGLALVLAGAGAVVAPVACDAGDVAAGGALVVDELHPLARATLTTAPATMA
jgi:hypothetical protein